MKKTCAFIIFMGVMILAGISGCRQKASLAKPEENDSTKNKTLREQIEDLRGMGGRIEVPVAKVTTGTISTVLSVTGELVPRKSVIVRPQMDGRIIFLRPIKVGDFVNEGDVIAKIDDRDIEDEISRQERQIQISKEAISLDENQFKQKEKDVSFDRELVRQGFLNENDLRRSELELKRAEIALRQSRLALEQEQNKLEQVLRKREKVPIKATISGMVVLASHLTGREGTSDLLREEIMALDDTLVNTGTQLFGIVSQENFLAQCLVNSKDKAKLEVGQKAEVTVITHKVISVPGELVKLDQLQDAKTRAYKVWIQLQEVDKSFTSGLFVRANIELARSENAVVIPREFVKERDNREFVQIVKKGAVDDVWVATGLKQGKNVEILTGLSVGDLLIVTDKALAKDQLVTAKELKEEKKEETTQSPSPFIK